LVGIRIAFLLGTAATLLWAPRTGEFIPNSAWDARSDLIFGTFDQWDARWFLHIARDGYNATSAAFFPIYPAILALLGSSLVLGTMVSLVAAGVGAWCVAEIVRPKLGDEVADNSVLVLALFPTAFVFTSLYSDGLFLAFSAAAFLAAQHRRPWIAGLAGGLAVGTRSIGLALLPALVFLLWPRRTRDIWQLAPLLLLPAALNLYALYLNYAIGDPWAFLGAQASPGWERSVPTLGPVSGLWMAAREGWHGGLEVALRLPRTHSVGATGFPPPDQLAFWNATHLLLLICAAGLTWVAWTRVGTASGIYGACLLVMILSAPSKNFPLVSLPRFLLTDFPVLTAIGVLIHGRPRLRTAVLVSLGAASAAAGVAFARGVWVA